MITMKILYLQALLLGSILGFEHGDKAGVCTLLGANHFTTFDGVQHDFQGLHEYHLASDCETGRFNVFTKHQPLFEGSQISNAYVVAVIVDFTFIIIDRDVVEVNNKIVDLPKKGETYTITRNGKIVTIDTTAGVRVTFDMLRSIRVTLPEEYLGKTCGLCGVWNCDQEDDLLMSQDFMKMEVDDAVRHFPGPPPAEPPTCDPKSRSGAENKCQETFGKHQCDLVDYSPYMESCITDMCVCGDSCLEDHVLVYSQACEDAAKGIRSPCEPEPAEKAGICSTYGAQHFNTFDGVHYKFQGTCWYTLASDCVDRSWEVQIKSASPQSGAGATTVREMRVIAEGSVIEMNKDTTEVVLNGEVISLPYETGIMTISRSGETRSVWIMSDSVAITYTGSIVTVAVEERWHGSTCGLCGKWDEDVEDETILAEPLMANKFAVEGQTCTAKVTPKCTEEMEQDAATKCQAIGRLSGHCPAELLDKYIDECISDLCVCGDSCLCDMIQAAAMDCAQHSHDPELRFIWRQETQSCQGEGEIGLCSAWGDPHYTTFDGYRHHFQGMCSYVFAADCWNDQWMITTRNEAVRRNARVSAVAEVGFMFEGNNIVISRDGLTVNGQRVDSATSYQNFTVSFHGRVVEVGTRFGVTVLYDRRTHVKVQLDQRWLGRTCGLCGQWNHQIDDEIAMNADHEAVEAYLGLEECVPPLPLPECPAEMMQEAERKCKIIFEHVRCNEVDPQDAIGDCVMDLCACGDDCLCDVPKGYMEECYSATGDPYYLEDVCQGGGVIGECSAWGDPHYTTFDGHRHHFQGMCSYVFAADCYNDQWMITTRNEPVFRNAPVSAVAEVGFLFEGNDIVISRDGLTVNGERVDSPSYYETFTVSFHRRIVEISTTFGVTVSYDRRSHVKVKLDERWLGTTCGLCGQWNQQTDDEIAMTADHEAMETYLGLEECAPPLPFPECPAEMMHEAARKCKNVFEEIRCNEVDPEVAIGDCIMDLCACGEDCFCDVLDGYREECYSATRDPYYLESYCQDESATTSDIGICSIHDGYLIKTFDKFDYPVQGSCWYVFAKDCKESSWEVHTEIVQDDDGAALGNVMLMVKESVIAIDRETRSIMVNGEEVFELPYEGDDFVIGIEDGALAVVALNDSLAVTYRGTEMSVVVKPRWFDSTCGLCGNWDQRTEDEKLLSNQAVANTFVVERGACVKPGETSEDIGICSVHDGHFIKTFDDLDYSFQGTCWYEFVEDSEENSWQVHMEIVQNDTRMALGRIRMKVNTAMIEIDGETATILVDNSTVTRLPYEGDNFVIGVEDEALVVVALEDSVAVTVSGTDLNVVVKNRWFDSTSGLCGQWNKKTDDEELLKNPSVASTFRVEGELCTGVDL